MLYSFGLENALERAKLDISFFLQNVYEAATVSLAGGLEPMSVPRKV